MLEVNLIKKSTDSITKKVKRNIASTKELQKPDINNKNCYNNFIDEIAKSFNIENKKEIILLAIDLEEDEIPINNQKDLEELGNEIQYFNIYLEKVKNIEEEKNDDFNEDENDFDIHIDINMEIKDIDIINSFNKIKTKKLEEKKRQFRI